MQFSHDLDPVADSPANFLKWLKPALQISQGNGLALGRRCVDIEGPDFHGSEAFRKQAFRQRPGIAHEGHLIIIRPARLIRRANIPALHAFRVVIIARAGVVAAYPVA